MSSRKKADKETWWKEEEQEWIQERGLIKRHGTGRGLKREEDMGQGLKREDRSTGRYSLR